MLSGLKSDSLTLTIKFTQSEHKLRVNRIIYRGMTVSAHQIGYKNYKRSEVRIVQGERVNRRKSNGANPSVTVGT